MKKVGGEEERNRESKRRGRPTRAEQLGRQRAGSVGSISDSFKRKREEEEQEEERLRAEKEIFENFQKSRKVGRSPPQGKSEGKDNQQERSKEEDNMNKETEKIDKLMEIMLTVKKDTEDIKKELRREMKELREEWKKKQEEWERVKLNFEMRINELESKKDQNEEMKEKIREVLWKEEKRERREKRNNIVIKGADIPMKETPREAAEEIVKQNLQVEAPIEEAYWVRGRRGGSFMVVKFKEWQQKMEIMMKKNKLKGKRLFIDNDLTKKERDIQREIAQVARAEKEQGAQVKIGYKKLRVNEKIFKWKEEGGFEEAKFWSRRSSADL